MTQNYSPKVLIIDDEIDNINALKRLLRRQFNVFTAESGEEALAIVQREPDFDVIVSDQRMPGMTGSEFFQKVLEVDSRPTRILLTGFADLEAVIEAINNGHIWRYISKPWEPDDLIQTLKQAAERTQMSRSLEKSKKDLEVAFTGLKAKDWARDRLFQILLHEFRTGPQIIENLRALDSAPGEDSEVLRSQLLDNLQKRFQILESDIKLLLEDEKDLGKLEQQECVFPPLLRKICLESGVDFEWLDEAESPQDETVLTHKPYLTQSIAHFIELMKSNSKAIAPKVSLSSTDKTLYCSLLLEGDKGQALLPKGLEGASLHPNLAWTALLEPFVGVEDFQHHSTGLRVETARWVRFFHNQGIRPEFQISGSADKIELIISIPRAR